MNLLKRLSYSLAASFEEIMNQVENHEALVDGAIAEMREASARAQTRMKRVRTDGERMTARITVLRNSIQLWEERAKRTSTTDREKALVCIERRDQCKKELLTLEREQKEHEQLCRQLERDLSTIGSKISELNRRKNVLAAQELRAQTLSLAQPAHILAIDEVDEIFERWEEKINQRPLHPNAADPLEDGFISEERRCELEAELELLLKHTD